MCAGSITELYVELYFGTAALCSPELWGHGGGGHTGFTIMLVGGYSSPSISRHMAGKAPFQLGCNTGIFTRFDGLGSEIRFEFYFGPAALCSPERWGHGGRGHTGFINVLVDSGAVWWVELLFVAGIGNSGRSRAAIAIFAPESSATAAKSGADVTRSSRGTPRSSNAGCPGQGCAAVAIGDIESWRAEHRRAG